jgi:integrase/recombinase XerC/integrase/recombinase XerD
MRPETQLQTRETLLALVEAFAKAQDVKPSSRGTYRRMLSRFVEWLSAHPTTDLSRETILAYKASLEEKRLSPLTLSGYLVAVRKFFEWTEANKLYPNIARGVKGGKRSKGFRKDPLTVDQIKELLGSVNRSTLEGKRDYALLNLLVRTGLRTIEAVRADLGDIRQEGGEAVLWIQGKGRDAKDEFVLLTPDTLKPMRDYLTERGAVEDSSPLFVSHSDRNRDERLTTRTLSRIAKATLRGIGLNSGRLTAHSLRHTAITLSLQAGATIQEAQALGRHANINTTLVYAHNINRIAHAPERKIEELLRAG